ncbi:MAG: S41 family peptidase [Proteobacteria bacterium]|nr:S41 family peptidase [Burkholderiales bacterium]
MRSKASQIGLICVGVVLGVLVSLNFSAVAQRDASGPLPVEDLRVFTEVFARIKSDYVETVEDRKLFNEAINGMLSGLDPHSAYLDQEAFKELQVGTQGEFGGLGIEVGMEDGLVRVVSPIDDTPASRAGLRPGDLIIRLDDTPVKGMALNDAVRRMRGKPNTQITLTIVRRGEDKPVVVTLTRAVIKIQSVRSAVMEPGFGYIRLTQFQEMSGENLARAIDRVWKENNGTMRGLILDLRNDPGGLLNGAVAVSAAFLPTNALVVYTDGRAPDSRMKLNASPEFYLRGASQVDYLRALPKDAKSVPMVVLINGGSASASEIVAGALQDHKRATIIGTQSFGKGSVQTILPLTNNTAIKLTTARYFTPNGRSIQAKGITPDIVVEDPSNPSDNQRVREADLDRHLSDGKGGQVVPAPKPRVENKKDEPARPRVEPIKLEPGQVFSREDFQLMQALNHLKGQPVLRDLPVTAAVTPTAAGTAATPSTSQR